MKRTIWTAALTACALTAAAQEESSPAPLIEGGRIYRTEVVPYNARHDADARNRQAGGYWMDFHPELITESEGDIRAFYGSKIDIPFEWTDGRVFLHLENTGAGYSLWLNDRPVAEVNDPLTPSEFDLTPYIRQGVNNFRVLIHARRMPIDGEGVRRPIFENSYLYYQNKRSIADFEIALVPDSLGRDFGMLDLKIVACNAYNYDEPVTVGYDIYSPQGKLLEFNMTEITIPGRSTDTVRYSPFIYHTYDNCWEAGSKNPPLYSVMLFTRRNGVYKEYMPLKIGFGKTELVDGRLMRLGKELQLVRAEYNAAADPKTTLAELKALKAKGKNTICPSYPQPAWFYELCNEVGLYVIDRAAIDAPEKRDDRRVGGTPSNDPRLVDEYLERVKSMYYRSRNFTCVIAYDLGCPSGNGYNMYKAYEWLKTVEKNRPVIYSDADGEWNSDL